MARQLAASTVAGGNGRPVHQITAYVTVLRANLAGPVP